MGNESPYRERMNIVIAGHIDHGKSTIIGRLLAETGSLPEGKVDQIRENGRGNSRKFEYAFLVDALKEEQAQGITIDSARVFFATEKRQYIFIDAPGHIEFLKNMITGASRAEAALLVIDASEGVQENSRRHGYMLAMLGITQIALLINKMDLVQYNRSIYEEIVGTYSHFLSQMHIEPLSSIPVSGIMGDNIVAKSTRNMPWSRSGTVFEVIDNFITDRPAKARPFRMPVQDVYTFSETGNTKNIIVGTVETGSISKGEEIVFYPSGKKSRVKTIEEYNAQRDVITAGYPAGITLAYRIHISRGEMASKAGEQPPCVSTRFLATLFWMGRKPLITGKRYLLKLGTAKTQMEIEEIMCVINTANLSAKKEKNSIERYEAAECIIKTAQLLAFDIEAEIPSTCRFVIIDEYEIQGGGIIRKELDFLQ